MTSTDISNFLTSIGEAKRAYEAEPFYQNQIAELERDKQRLGETVAARELRIHELKQNEETLTQKLRSVEAERDDAGFRALEEADKVQGLLTVVRQYVGDGLKIISSVEGHEQVIVTRQELEDWRKTNHDLSRASDNQSFRIAELERMLVESERDVQRLQEEKVMAQQAKVSPSPFASVEDTPMPSSSAADTDHWYKEQPVNSGLRDAVPISATSTPIASTGDRAESDGPFAATGPTITSQDVPSTTAESETSAASDASQTQRERNRDRSTFFTGRKYYDVTYYVPLHEWLNCGGTQEDYDWRPETLPSPSRASHQS